MQVLFFCLKPRFWKVCDLFSNIQLESQEGGMELVRIGCLLLACILILWIIGSLYKLGISFFSILLQIFKILVLIAITYYLIFE